MTVVITEAEAGIITMGADSAIGPTDEVYTHPRHEKAFVRGPYLVGHCGIARIGQILRYDVELPEPPAEDDLTPFLVHSVVPEIRRAVQDAGAAQEGRALLGDKTAILLGLRGQLFVLGNDLMVLRANDVAAIGSGRHRAYAAMHALKAAGVGPARRRIELALAATAAYTSNVRPPFHFVTSTDS